MADEPDPDRLRALEDRLAQAKSSEAESTAAAIGESHRQGQLAWRMVTELVAGLLIGFGIGYGLDALFETRPWLMVIFTLLGFAAGVKTMIRSAREMESEIGGSAGDEGNDDGERSEHR
ncbi:MAG: AtpZ/AtpI family protein [Pseudomonadota bacterium]